MLKALQSFFNVAPAAEQTKQYHAEGLSDEAFLSLILMTEISLAMVCCRMKSATTC